ncbi:TonB-dependent receptor [Chitinophagaceae bacterium LB-8]|uniref:TonB-dependent receptor n=1 Tax=Paraflavisolibacter caeni TaxID=2982496 RepID=A0A9X2Y0R3_9BACT|nr:TonB-dependent receptor [Paraflavisolibacter caeni]MCU7552535.1 TonB-dependent receptor [Paraflavisolibacter caeni]
MMKQRRLLLWMLGFLCLVFQASNSYAQELINVQGTVKDKKEKTPLAGVTITSLTDKRQATAADANGNFQIKVPLNSKLALTMTGYQATTVVVKSRQLIIEMEAVAGALDDVVVVAYGKQKKTEVVGSVTTIKPADLKIPASNLTQAFAGKIAGLIAFQSSGEPGKDNADFFIHGVTTFGYRKSPLILIDNIESSTDELARLQIDDVSNFSIMKDAAATALYGAKGANGVILVTTKEGKESPVTASVRLENSLSTPTQNVQLADPVTYMELANEASVTRNPLAGYRYQKTKIENTRLGTDPLFFPATDWQQMLIKDYTNNQRANLNLSGGGKVARYYVSGSYNQDNGILKVDKKSNFSSNPTYKTYSLRSNININLTKTTELKTMISGLFTDYIGPVTGGSAIFAKIMQTNPVLFPAYYETTPETKYVKHIMFGNSYDGRYNNPYADVQKGYQQQSASTINTQIQISQNLAFITKGLSARGLVSTQRYSYFDLNRSYVPYYYVASNYDFAKKTYSLNPINMVATPGVIAPVGNPTLNYVPGARNASSNFYSELALNYSRVYKNVHSVSGTLVGIAKSSLSASAGSLQESLPFRNLGVSGRLTYVYDTKLASEFNFGYNGSERFYKTHRYGFFPSIGVGYTISNEQFWDNLKPVISKLKLKATHGLVGNDAIGTAANRFFYLSDVDMNSAARASSFGLLQNGFALNGILVNRYANNDITWEQAQKSNLGAEMTLYKNWNMNVDVYKEKRTNILMQRASIPTTMGLPASALASTMANVGEASSQGVDFDMDYTYYAKRNFWVKGMANFTYATNQFDVYEEPEYSYDLDGKTVVLDNKTHTGKNIAQNWGYIAERLFVDDAEAANSPKQQFPLIVANANTQYGGGDIKYRDLNNDGKIDELDMAPIGYPTTPEIQYGFGMSMGYKGFDFSVFFQGTARRSFWIDPVATSPFIDDQRQLLQVYADNHWSEDNRDIYALWPRLSTDLRNNNLQPSTWFMRSGSFLRIKQAEVGYTLPESLRRKFRLSNARFYLNASNLFTFSNFKLWDIEMGGNGLGYPIQRVVNAGVTFSIR